MSAQAQMGVELIGWDVGQALPGAASGAAIVQGGEGGSQE